MRACPSGTEVKSIKEGRFSFADSYAQIDRGELWLIAFHVTPYPFGNRYNQDPLRKASSSFTGRKSNGSSG